MGSVGMGALDEVKIAVGMGSFGVNVGHPIVHGSSQITLGFLDQSHITLH